MATAIVRFRGSEARLETWRRLLCETVGREPSAIRSAGDRYSPSAMVFDVEMSEADREAMMAYWRSAAPGDATLATGRPLRWNDCLTFEEVRS
jgi:hypothetical protein